MRAWNDSDIEWVPPPRGLFFWSRAILRLIAIVLWTIIIFPVFLIVRYGQRILGLLHNEYFIFRLWGKGVFIVINTKINVHGALMKRGGVLVSNHASLLDIPVLYAAAGGNMIAKAEIRSWPIVGFMARLQGVEFVVRAARESKRQIESIGSRLRNKDRMILFAEGTTSDGLCVLPFKTTLFAAMVEAHAGGFVQPVSIIYHAPKGASANFYGLWGDMENLPSAIAILGLCGRQHIDVVLHEPIPIGDDRKALSALTHSAVVEGFKRFSKEH